MSKPTRRSRLFLNALLTLTLALSGCASAVDEDGAASDETLGAASNELIEYAATDARDASAEDGDFALETAASRAAAYGEFTSIGKSADASLDASAAAANSCTRFCACCARGNRYCCSHCDFCSGPIKLSPAVLSK